MISPELESSRGVNSQKLRRLSQYYQLLKKSDDSKTVEASKAEAALETSESSEIPEKSEDI